MRAKTCLLGLFTLSLALAGNAEEPDVAQALEQLSKAKEANVLYEASITIAAKGDESALLQLAKHLGNKKWLDQLKAGQPWHEQLMPRFKKILYAAVKRPEPEVRKFFIALLETDFQGDDRIMRRDLNASVVHMCGSLRPPSKEIVNALVKNQKDERYTCPILERLGSPYAYEFVESQIRKAGGFQQMMARSALEHRGNPNAMRMWLSLIRDGKVLSDRTVELFLRQVFTLPKPKMPFASDVFQFPAPAPEKIAWADVPRESLKVILQIADLAPKLDVPAELKLNIAQGQERIRAVLNAGQQDTSKGKQ